VAGFIHFACDWSGAVLSITESDAAYLYYRKWIIGHCSVRISMVVGLLSDEFPYRNSRVEFDCTNDGDHGSVDQTERISLVVLFGSCAGGGVIFGCLFTNPLRQLGSRLYRSAEIDPENLLRAVRLHKDVSASLSSTQGSRS